MQSASPKVRSSYRSSGQSVVGWAGGPLFTALMATFGVLSLDNADVIVIAAIGIAMGVWATVRFSRCGVYLEDGGVRVLNPFSSTHLRWAEISEFVLVPYGSCRVKRVHGRTVLIFGIQQTAWNARRGKKDTQERAMIDELNALVQWHRAALAG